MVWLLVKIIRLYQLVVSPFVRSQCRFTPTCSQYTIVALQAHGLFKGGWMSLKRVLSCQPFGKASKNSASAFNNIDLQEVQNPLLNKKIKTTN